MTNATQSSWEPYLKYGIRSFYKRRSVIYKKNDESTKGFYYLEKGLIKITTDTFHQDNYIIDIVSSQMPFGEQGTDGNRYFSTATALEDSIVYFFPEKDVQEVMKTDIQFSMLIYNHLTKKLKTLSDNILLHSLPAEKQLALALLSLMEKFESIHFPFSQKELCAYTNLNRITIYHILKKWDKQIVTVENKRIYIEDVDALKKVAMLS